MKRKPNNGAGPKPREAAGAADPGGAGERNNYLRVFGTKCPKVKIPAEKQPGESGGIQTPHEKSAGKSWIGQRKSWQNRSRPKSRAR